MKTKHHFGGVLLSTQQCVQCTENSSLGGTMEVNTKDFFILKIPRQEASCGSKIATKDLFLIEIQRYMHTCAKR